MYRTPEILEKMSRRERIEYFDNLGKTSFPKDKMKFTDEELMTSFGFCGYEIFRGMAKLEEVGYFDLADRVFRDRFNKKWVFLDRGFGKELVYIERLLPPYQTDLFYEDELDGMLALNDDLLEDNFWGMLFVKRDDGREIDVPYCKVRSIEIADEVVKDKDEKARYLQGNLNLA